VTGGLRLQWNDRKAEDEAAFAACGGLANRLGRPTRPLHRSVGQGPTGADLRFYGPGRFRPGSFLSPEAKASAHDAQRGSDPSRAWPRNGREHPAGEKAFRPVPGLSRVSCHSQGSRLGLLSFALRACRVSAQLALMERGPGLRRAAARTPVPARARWSFFMTHRTGVLSLKLVDTLPSGKHSCTGPKGRVVVDPTPARLKPRPDTELGPATSLTL